jgi:uncharacterized repeat protein (TIGR01451 family)
VLSQLKQLGVEHRSYWVANMIWVRGGMGAVQAMAQRGDVAHVYANPQVRLDEPVSTQTISTASVDTARWNLTLVNADDVWAAGYRGQGAVVGGQDTGYQWDHPALKNQYRGWDGTTADHNYSWHDAIHAGTSSCGVNLSVPCDDYGHGTHTMGTMVGDDGGINQIGMAPQAKWIGCRNMVAGVGSPDSYTECYQWFIAPTDLEGKNARPELAPDVINNSWSCTTAEGCDSTNPTILLEVVQNVRAAGILTVHSAGNTGPNCSTISAPAAIYDESYTVGSVNQYDIVPAYSSRGPVTVDGSNRIKPDISAPGSDIYSSVPTNIYGLMTGTSMAAPHVAGLAALLISADPEIAGHPDEIETKINATAKKISVDPVQTCGGIASTVIPNNTFGYGRINAQAAFLSLDPLLLTIAKTAAPDAVIMGEVITYTITVANTHASQSTTNVIVTETLPLGTTFASTDAPYTLENGTITWNVGTLESGQERSLTLAVRVGFDTISSVTNLTYSARSDQAAQVFGVPVTTTIQAIPLYYTFLPVAHK